MGREEPELADFQARLLDLLSRGGDAEEIRETLLAEYGKSDFSGFIEQMEPRMVEVASELVRKWGRLRSPR